MASRAMVGLLKGLGEGIADVGKLAYAAQIEDQRLARLRQYQREDYAQQRADRREERGEERVWQSENEQRLYTRGRTDDLADYERTRSDQLADRAHGDARADAAARMAAQLKAEKWSDLEPIKSRDEFGNEQVIGFVGSKGGQMQLIDLKDGRILPLASDQDRMQALSSLVDTEYQPTPAQPPAASQPPAQPPAAPSAPQAQAQAPQAGLFDNVEQQMAVLEQLEQQRQARIEATRAYQPVTATRAYQPVTRQSAPAPQPRPWQGSTGGLLNYLRQQQ